MSTAPTEAGRWLAGGCAHWLRSGAKACGALALLAAAAALVLLLQQPPAAAAWAAAAVLMLLLPERVLSLRLHFDAGLFADLAAAPTPASPVTLVALDQALAGLGLRKLPADASAPRPLAERVQGAGRLVRWHAVVVGLQWLLLGLALATRLGAR